MNVDCFWLFDNVSLSSPSSSAISSLIFFAYSLLSDLISLMYFLCVSIFELMILNEYSTSVTLSLSSAFFSRNNWFILLNTLMSNKSSITSRLWPAGSCIKGMKLLLPNTTTWWNVLWLSFRIFCSSIFWYSFAWDDWLIITSFW